jgi:hypothetical protein
MRRDVEGGRQQSDEPVASGGSGMRARRWVVASCYREPADYGIPPLPRWSVRRTDGGGLALAASEAGEPFVSAADPVRVRR